MASPFSQRKAAQVAAFFCRQAGGTINLLKLVKLIYLGDRLSLERSGAPITFDNFVSMRHGPVVSETYNLIKGESDSVHWGDLISDRERHMVGLARELTDADVDELSAFEERVLEEVWAKFGGMDRFELVDWTHKHCPEWEDPGDSSQRIPIERLFKFLDPENADELSRRYKEEQGLRAALFS